MANCVLHGLMHAGSCARLVWLKVAQNQITALPDAICQLTMLQGLDAEDNRIASLPDGLLSGCSQLCTLSLRDNPLKMERMRELPGFEVFAARRRGKLDRAIDGGVQVDLTEAADYERFHRH